MWRSDTPSTSANGKHSSVTNLARSPSSTSLIRRAISFQFLNKEPEVKINPEQRAYIKMRYKDVSKHVIWPGCRLPDKRDVPKPAPYIVTSPRDPRAVLMKPEIEDHKSPYLPCTINHVLRSDSEDSSDAEQVLEMTRL